jgi:hypothetical protein
MPALDYFCICSNFLKSPGETPGRKVCEVVLVFCISMKDTKAGLQSANPVSHSLSVSNLAQGSQVTSRHLQPVEKEVKKQKSTFVLPPFSLSCLSADSLYRFPSQSPPVSERHLRSFPQVRWLGAFSTEPFFLAVLGFELRASTI